jgi:MoaA/NifB/PqqE/SkfB family radical SAM enzyme
MEEALAGAAILSESQKRNARLKAEDLHEERLVWKSVPFRLMVEFNRRCNGNCIHCEINRDEIDDLDPVIFEKLMNEVGWGTMEVMPFVGGEPTLSPIVPIARLARAHNNYLNFITNGLLFTRDYYDQIADIIGRVHFSFNSHRPDVYQYISPALDFHKIVANIGDAVRIAERTGAQIVAGLVVMNCNIKELDDYIRFVADMGVRRVILQKLYPWSSIFEKEGIDGQYAPDEVKGHLRRALKAAIERGIYVETNLSEIFGDPQNRHPGETPFDILQNNADVVELFHPGFCISAAVTVLVEWDGTLVPCCRDRIVMGNLYESRFGDLWNGERMQRLRESFFKGELRPFCRQCMDFYCGHA